MTLSALLDALRTDHGSFDLVAHFQQGEFHHAVVLRLRETATALPGPT